MRPTESETWRNASIVDLGLEADDVAQLERAGLTTVGLLKDWWADERSLREIDGISAPRADRIATAYLKWRWADGDSEVLYFRESEIASTLRI
jgi:hypothetical protein